MRAAVIGFPLLLLLQVVDSATADWPPPKPSKTRRPASKIQRPGHEKTHSIAGPTPGPRPSTSGTPTTTPPAPPEPTGAANDTVHPVRDFTFGHCNTQREVDLLVIVKELLGTDFLSKTNSSLDALAHEFARLFVNETVARLNVLTRQTVEIKWREETHLCVNVVRVDSAVAAGLAVGGLKLITDSLQTGMEDTTYNDTYTDDEEFYRRIGETNVETTDAASPSTYTTPSDRATDGRTR